MTDLQVAPKVLHARTAVSAAFLMNGLSSARSSPAPPPSATHSGCRRRSSGLLLLCISVGAIAGCRCPGRSWRGFGPARTVLCRLPRRCGRSRRPPAARCSPGRSSLTAPGLFLIGLGHRRWDVAMNVEGADVEQHLGRSLMPRLHAGFSLGTVAGAGIGAAAAAVDVPLSAQVIVARGRWRRCRWPSRPVGSWALSQRRAGRGERGPPLRCPRRLAGAADPARGRYGARVRVHRGVGERLDGRGDGRRLRHRPRRSARSASGSSSRR